MSAARAFDTYDLPDFVVGNTWAGIPLYTVTPAQYGVLTEVEIEFRTGSPANPAYVDLSSSKVRVSGTLHPACIPQYIFDLQLPQMPQSQPAHLLYYASPFSVTVDKRELSLL